MPADVITHSTQDVVNDVLATFGDTSGVQISSSDIIRWDNNAQQEIVMRNPELLPASVFVNIVNGTADYPLLANVPDVLTIQSIHYNNKPLNFLSFQDAERFIMDNNMASGSPEMWFERAGIVTIYPTPAVDLSAGLKIYYQKRPTKVETTSDMLSLPDFYYNSVVSFCMEQANLLDENPQLAQIFGGKFDQSVQRLANRTESQSDSYPYLGTIPEEYY